MAGESSDLRNGVLYEVLVSTEWNKRKSSISELHTEKQHSDLPVLSWLRRVFYPILWLFAWLTWVVSEFIAKFNVPDLLIQLRTAEIPWKLAAVRPGKENSQPNDGVVAAILTDTTLELRNSSDGFDSTSQTFTVDRDPFPSFRSVVWSRDGKFVAVGSSSGTLSSYDYAKAEPHTLPSKTSTRVASGLLRQQLISSMFWIGRINRDTELLVFYASGLITSFSIRSDKELTEGWSSNCKKSLPRFCKGTLSAVHGNRQNLVVISSAVTSIVDDDIRYSWNAGLSLWRFVDETPFLLLVSDAASDEALQSAHGYRKFAEARDGAWKISLNPSETSLLTLFLSGSVAVWSFPSMRLRKFYNVETMPKYESEINCSTTSSKLESIFGLDAHLPLDAQWWSDTVIVLCQAGGMISLLDVTERVLTNVSHGSFEQFHPNCAVSQNLGDRFLILEESTSKDGDISLNNEEEDMVSAVRETLRTISSEDMTKGGSPTEGRVSYRLNIFQKASPLDMFNRKLQNEEYGDALLLARRFDLNLDVVYQRRWMQSRITKETISDFLMKVKDVSWALRECLDRVPDNPDVVRELLNLGLRLTELSSIVKLSPECYDKKGKIKENHSAVNIDVTKLTPEQLALIGHRRQICRFNRFLSAYEEMLGGGEKASRYFLATEYGELRRMTPLAVALFFAGNCKAKELHTFRFFYHEDLFLYWLDVLNHFPETYPPGEYQFLIPSVWNDQVVEVQRAPDEVQDWCEEEPFNAVLDNETKSRQEEVERLTETMEYKGELNGKVLNDWFNFRAREIERRTGNILNAQQLVEVASAKGVSCSDDLFDDLNTLASLVYYCGQIELSLSEMLQIPPRKVLGLLEQQKKPEAFPTALRQHMVPFLIRCEKKETGSRQILMREFVLEAASDPQAGLNKCLKIFQQSMTGMPEPAIDSMEETVRLALACISTTPTADQLELMKTILQSIPSSSEILAVGLDRELADEVENMMELIRTIEFAEGFGLQLSVKNLLEIQQTSECSVDFLKHILSRAVQKPAGFSEFEWKDIYTSYIKTCQKVFSAHIGLDKALELFVTALLMSGKSEYIQLSTKFLPLSAQPLSSPRATHAELWKVSKKLSKESSALLLQTAGRDYLATADDYKDDKTQNAKRCFDLASEIFPEVRRDAQLIDALSFLHGCGLDLAPLELLTASDRFIFIKRALDTRSDLYKDQARLQELAVLLGVQDRNDEIVKTVAAKALEKKDFAFCRGLCQKMMVENHPSAWEICVKLASSEGVQDAEFRERILLFAAVNCPPEYLNKVMNLKTRIQVLPQRKISLPEVEQEERDPIAKLAIDPCFLNSSDQGKLVRSLGFSSLVKEVKSLGSYACSLLEEQSGNDVSEVLIAAASKCMDVDAGLSLFLLGCLPDKRAAERLFDTLPQTPAVRRFAVYFYALELSLNRTDAVEMENVLNLSEATIVDRAASEASSGDKKDVSLTGLMRKYLSIIPPKQPPVPVRRSERIAQKEIAKAPPPSEQAETSVASSSSQSTIEPVTHPTSTAKTSTTNFRTFLKGVDEIKFRSNAEYRKNFILRSAATKDVQTFQKLLQLAEEYGVETWEVMAALIKYLVTISGFSADELTIFLSKVPALIETLKSKKIEFLRFSNQNIQPYMGNADIAVLEYYLDFLHCIEKVR